ncbi:MAG TPA: hypothetical protein VF478_08730, partial [Anaerolineae bacterium]
MLLGWIAARAPGKWAPAVLAGLLVIILILGFAAGLNDLLLSYAMANLPAADSSVTVGSEQFAHSQEMISFCDGCHAPTNDLSLGTKAVSLSGNPSIVFMPVEIFGERGPSQTEEIVAYPQVRGPDLKLVVSGWSETDFVKTLREGKNPEGFALDRGMPWKDIAAFATDDELRAYYEYP